ncbi:site-specific integrase [Streptomyces sp. NPDC005963]|uniref:tyrosine-type recombinase/integrase n=1 Tax=Streptomyces sp. NPDC005963 TaxID=3156721 RepID=UPI0033DFB25F
MALTYSVRIWGIRNRPSKSAPFQLRWLVGDQTHQQPFQTKTLADGRRAELMSAVREGEQFDTVTGLPVSELRKLSSPTWFTHACAYALMKWPTAAAKHRASIAESMTAVTSVLVTSSKGAPNPKTLRSALSSWAFQMVRQESGELTARMDAETPPADIAQALEWVATHSVQVADVPDSDQLRRALAAISRRLDGKRAADNTIRRKRMVLSNALRYAVERDLLATNPLGRIDWAPPQTDDEVDFQYVPGPVLARGLLEAVRASGARGEQLHAFFGCLYYAAMRPSEVAALTKKDCKLPASGWGELVLRGSRPEVGSGWTDDGRSYEDRGLKRRARRSTRSVPIPPILVALLRLHLQLYGVSEDGRLFRAARGGRVRSTEYCGVWDAAREKALSADEVETLLADVPYSLRHAGVSLWIKAGVDPVEVARRAGHTPAVLWKFYAKILRGQQQASNSMIDDALASPDHPQQG